MRAFLTLVLLVVLVLITAFAVSYQAQHEFSLRFFTANEQRGLLLRNIVFALAMLGGIVMGHLHTILNATDKQVISRTDFTLALMHKGLWLSLLASPIIFGVVYALNERQPNTVMATLLAFENGFFCHSILKKRSARYNSVGGAKPTRNKRKAK